MVDFKTLIWLWRRGCGLWGHQGKLSMPSSSARFCAHAHVTLAGICHQSKRASILGRPFLMMISWRRIICVVSMHLVESIRRLVWRVPYTFCLIFCGGIEHSGIYQLSFVSLLLIGAICSSSLVFSLLEFGGLLRTSDTEARGADESCISESDSERILFVGPSLSCGSLQTVM